MMKSHFYAESPELLKDKSKDEVGKCDSDIYLFYHVHELDPV